MNNFDNLKKFILKYFLILLGLTIFVMYMWNRFFRERTSKTLPLTLNIVYLVILIYICILFSYLIYTLIFPKKTNIIIEHLVELLFTPLKEFDMFIKNIPLIKPYYFKIIIYIFGKVEDLVINSNKFFYMFWLFPRLILLTALCIDIFIFHRFHYKYAVILFGLLLFLNKYIIYSFKYYKKQVINNFDNEIETILTEYVPDVDPFENNDDEPGPTMTLPFETFIEFQAKSIVYNNFEPNAITVFSTSVLKNQFWMHYFEHPDPISKEYFDLYGTNKLENYNDCNDFILKKIQEYLVNVLESSKRICLAIEYYKKNNAENKNIKLIKIFIYANYLMCWLYVLFISIRTYTISSQDILMIAKILITSQDSINAFSGIAEIEDDHLIFFYEKNDMFYYYIYYRMKLFYLGKLLVICLIVYNANFFVKIKNKCDIIKTLFNKILKMINKLVSTKEENKNEVN